GAPGARLVCPPSRAVAGWTRRRHPASSTCHRQMGPTVEENVIGSVPLFEALGEQDQAELRSVMSEASLRRGEILFNEGDPGDRLYVLTDGKVKLGHTAPDGRENLLAVLGPGEILGE